MEFKEVKEGVNSLDCVMRVTETLNAFVGENTWLSLAYLSRKVKFSKPTLYRILATLIKERYVLFDPLKKRYSLGVAAAQLAIHVHVEKAVCYLAHFAMERLSRKFEETVLLYREAGIDVRCINKCDTNNPIRRVIEVGDTAPMYACSAGKIILAYKSNMERESLLSVSPLKKITEKTVTNKRMLIEELDTVNQDGYAITESELIDGLFSVSAPVFIDDRVEYCVALLIPTFRVFMDSLPEYIEQTRECAFAISSQMNDVHLRNQFCRSDLN